MGTPSLSNTALHRAHASLRRLLRRTRRAEEPLERGVLRLWHEQGYGLKPHVPVDAKSMLAIDEAHTAQNYTFVAMKRTFSEF